MSKNQKPKKERIQKPKPFSASFLKRFEGLTPESAKSASIESYALRPPRRVFRALCLECYVYLSPEYRNSSGEAKADARKHVELTDHAIDVEVTYQS